MLAADAVVALEDDRRIPIEEQQRIVIRLIEQTETVDRGHRALVLGPHIDALDGGAALEQRLQIGRGQLANWRRLLCSRFVIHDERFSSLGSRSVNPFRLCS